MQTYDAWHNQVTLAEHSEKVGKFEIAEKNWFHALTVAESAPDGQELKVYTLQRLGRCAWALQRPQDAEQFFFLAMESSPSSEMIGSLSHDLAKLYAVYEKKEKAINYYRYAIELKTNVYGAQSEQVLSLTKEYEQALESWNKTSQPAQENPVHTEPELEVTTQVESPANLIDEIQEADSIMKQWEKALEESEIRHREGNYDECSRLWQEALNIAELGGKDTPIYCQTIEKVAQLLVIQGQNKKAEKLLLESYGIKMNVLGPNHDSVAKTTQELSIMYFEMGFLDKAEPWAKRSLDIYESLGVENEEHACALHNLAVLYHSKEDYTKSEPYYARALVQKQKIYGPTHIETINIMRGYADLLRKTDRDDAAEEMETAASGVLSGAYEVQPFTSTGQEEYIPVESI